MTVKLSSSWTSGLDEKAIKELRADILAAPVLRKRLKEILASKDQDADKNSFSITNLDKPHWELRVAENSGYRRALNEIISLIP